MNDDALTQWRRQKVSIDAAYGGEKIPIYLFLPRNARPPYQTIVFFPGSDAVYTKSSRNLWLQMVDFYMKSGRAVVYPVYKGTYERGVPQATGPNARRDLRVQRVKDVRRVVDYLETRPDLDSKRLLYYGLSLGATQAPFVLAVEPRFKAALLYAGGFSLSNTLPETQMQNYLPRVRLPVLLLTGRHDFQFPYETSQKVLFDRLGTPPANKRHVALDGGHLPPQYTEAVREMLAWTDRWLGPVARN